MKKVAIVALSASLLSLTSLSASAQPVREPGQPGQTGGAVIQQQPNTTGNDPSVSISRGATGADTVTTDSAAGGNASKPEQAVPNSSAGGSSR